jgi:hypothetical protein
MRNLLVCGLLCISLVASAAIIGASWQYASDAPVRAKDKDFELFLKSRALMGGRVPLPETDGDLGT